MFYKYKISFNKYKYFYKYEIIFYKSKNRIYIQKRFVKSNLYKCFVNTKIINNL